MFAAGAAGTAGAAGAAGAAGLQPVQYAVSCHTQACRDFRLTTSRPS